MICGIYFGMFYEVIVGGYVCLGIIVWFLVRLLYVVGEECGSLLEGYDLFLEVFISVGSWGKRFCMFGCRGGDEGSELMV